MIRMCRNVGKFALIPIPRTRTCVEDALLETYSHTSERWDHEADKERQANKGRDGAYPKRSENVNENLRHVTWNRGAVGGGRKRVDGSIPNGAMCWVWYRYPFVGLSMMHVLVSLRRDWIFSSYILSWRDGGLIPGLVPRPVIPGFPSKIHLPSNTYTISIPVPR